MLPIIKDYFFFLKDLDTNKDGVENKDENLDIE